LGNLLILLVGGNPLPNYVTARYMIDRKRNDQEALPVPDKFILLHSKNTKKYAEIIKEKIGLTGYEPLADLGNNERSRKTIIGKIKGKLNEFQKDNCKITNIHLNYTGGTKPMAVHAYNGVINFCKENKIESDKIIFSYLDPKEFKLVRDESENSYPTDGSNLRDKVKLSIKDLFEIHNMTYKEEPKPEIIKTETLNVQDFSSLEDFIFNVFYRLKKKKKINCDDIYKIPLETTDNGNDPEIYIMVMKGYQMFLFSCTTYEHAGKVKKKAFEAIFRAEQLGGDHATAVTVSCIDKIDEVDKDLKTFGDLQGRYKLIGRDKLINIEKLKKELTLIIKK
jgi:hypothetical protein